MLYIEQLSYSVSLKNHTSREVLRDIDLHVKQGEFLSIVGQNGCGKTTLLRLISGLIYPCKGHIRLKSERIEKAGQGVGIIFQDLALLPWKTVRGNLEFGLAGSNQIKKKERKRLAELYLSQINLTAFANHYPHQLSGGMKQRVAIARTLISEPEILLMDEPFASLDCLTRNSLQEEMIQVWKRSGKTIVFVTHNVDEAIYLSQRIVIMKPNPGRILSETNIDLPYPRNRTENRCQDIRGHILSLLRPLP